MAKAISKQQIRQNLLVDWLAAAVRFVQARWSMVMPALVAVGVAGAAGGGYWWYQERQEDQASRALAGAHTGLVEGQTMSPGNPDETIRRYREVVQQYRGTRSGEEGLIQLGMLQSSAGKVDDALGSFTEYLTTYSRGRFRVMAGLGRAYAQEAKGDLQGAAQTLSLLLERDRDDPLAGEAYVSLGRTYESLKKPDEAMRVYEQVVERYSQSQWAQRALERMSNLKQK